MSAERFGDALGELNRTGWTITGSRESDDDLDALLVNGGQRRATGGMRIVAKRQC